MKTVGIIGLGSIGLVHASSLDKMGHRVIGYDPSFERQEMLLEMGGGVAESAEEFYGAEKDAVVIATPTESHYALIYMYNKWPILVEKPIGATARCIVELDGSVNSVSLSKVTVGNNLRFHGCVQKAKEWVDKPIWANFTVAQYNARPQYLRDGVTLNWGAHEMDLALYLLGPAEVVGASIDKEDTIADILLLHESGCRTSLHFDYLTKNEVRTFLIQEEDKMIACNVPLGMAGTDAGDSYTWDKDFDETYVLEMKAFLDGDTSIAASGDDGLRCLRLLLDAKKMGGL